MEKEKKKKKREKTTAILKQHQCSKRWNSKNSSTIAEEQEESVQVAWRAAGIRVGVPGQLRPPFSGGADGEGRPCYAVWICTCVL